MNEAYKILLSQYAEICTMYEADLRNQNIPNTCWLYHHLIN